MPASKANDLKGPDDYTYDLGELICFYSRLSESAEVDAIEKVFDPALRKEGHLFKCVRDSEGTLVGLMRAWTDQTRGIVYDIAVSPEHRHKRAGTMLRDHVLDIRAQPADDKTPAQQIHWHGNPFRISAYLDRELSVIRTLFAISFVLGFQKIGEAIYFLVFQDHTHLHLTGWLIGLISLMTVGLGLLGFRFFWAIGNIRRFVLGRIAVLQPPRRRTLMLHIGFLFSFPVIFFFLCRLFQDFCSNLSLTPFTLRFTLAVSALLLLNVLWLWLLIHVPAGHARRALQQRPRLRRGPAPFWIINNSVLGVFMLVWLGFGYLLHWPSLLVAYGITFLFLANSLIDLLGTSEAYILGDAFSGG